MGFTHYRPRTTLHALTFTSPTTTVNSPHLADARAGLAFMFAAGALVAATSLVAKTLGFDAPETPALHPLQISAGRFAFALLALLVFLTFAPTHRPKFSGANWRMHLARSICGWLGVSAMFAAVTRMPIAEATALSFLGPVVTMVLAVAMLGERLVPRKLIAAGLALIGAALILRPGEDAFQIAGLFALASAGFMGLEAIFIKKLSDREPALRVLLINNTIGALVSLGVASVVWLWPSWEQWLLLIILGSVMVCAQALFIQSVKRGEASLVMPAFYSVLVFAALYDFLLYGVFPAFAGLAGAALILTSALILARIDGRG